MPTYEYQCKDCKKQYAITGTYEVLFSYTPLCPHCGSKEARKIIGKVGFILKGDGFYNSSNNSE